MEFGVSGFGFRISGMRFGVRGLRSVGWDLGYGVSVFGFRVSGSGYEATRSVGAKPVLVWGSRFGV